MITHETSPAVRKPLSSTEYAALEARARQAERAMQDAQQELATLCRELPVPFQSATGLPVDAMVASLLRSFHRALRAKIRFDEAAVADRPLS